MSKQLFIYEPGTKLNYLIDMGVDISVIRAAREIFKKLLADGDIRPNTPPWEYISMRLTHYNPAEERNNKVESLR